MVQSPQRLSPMGRYKSTQFFSVVNQTASNSANLMEFTDLNSQPQIGAPDWCSNFYPVNRLVVSVQS